MSQRVSVTSTSSSKWTVQEASPCSIPSQLWLCCSWRWFVHRKSFLANEKTEPFEQEFIDSNYEESLQYDFLLLLLGKIDICTLNLHWSVSSSRSITNISSRKQNSSSSSCSSGDHFIDRSRNIAFYCSRRNDDECSCSTKPNDTQAQL